MLKVFILGFEEPHAVVGKFLFEDERFIYLDDAGKRIKIPHKRVAYVEDWTHIANNTEDSVPFITNKAPRVGAAQPGTPQQMQQALEQTSPQDVAKIGEQLKTVLAQKIEEQQRAAMRSSQVDPEDLDEQTLVHSGEQIDLLLTFSGAKDGQFSLKVPKEIFEGQYTPALGREIFKVPQVQGFMSSEIMLDGLPSIRGTTVAFKVKSARSVGDILAKTDILGKMLGAATKSGSQYKTPFESGFSMAKSPFEEVPEILGKPNPTEDIE